MNQTDPTAAIRAQAFRDAEEICDEAGAVFTSKALNEQADGAYALMERFRRKAEEAEQTVAVVSPPTDRAGLRKVIARAIHRYDYAHNLSGNDMPSEHHRGEADAVLAVLGEPTSRAAADAVRALHQPMERGPFTICAHCSGWDGKWRCLGVVTDYPCQTVRALDGEQAAEAHSAGTQQQCPEREPLIGVQCSKQAGHEAHSDRPGRIWYPAPDAGAQQQPDTEALAVARATNQRLNHEKQRLESELAAYRRAVRQWEVSKRGTYIPHSSLRVIGKACGVDILGSVRHLKHFERVEQAESAIERVRAIQPRPFDPNNNAIGGAQDNGWNAALHWVGKALDSEPAPVAQQPAAETRTTWTPGPVAVAQAAEWARQQQAADEAWDVPDARPGTTDYTRQQQAAAASEEA